MTTASRFRASSAPGPVPRPDSVDDVASATLGEMTSMGGAGSPQTPPEPLVSAHDLSVGYSDEPVCAPATFNLLPGQVLALVGVNGAGKSTILRMLRAPAPASR